MPDILLFTAADARFATLAGEMIGSVRRTPTGRGFALALLDCGLAEDQRRRFEADGVLVVDPDWPLPLPPGVTRPGRFKAMVARPFLADLVPGHALYVWLDADTWVQTDGALADLIAAGAAGDFAVVPEVDPAYAHLYDAHSPLLALHAERYAAAFPDAVAAGRPMPGRQPVLNSGVFALPGASPVWRLWQEALSLALSRIQDHFVEQNALAHVLYERAADLRIVRLPALYNWVCVLARPVFDAAAGAFVEPGPPHRPIGILHMAGDSKADTLPVACLQGGTLYGLRAGRRRIRYGVGDPPPPAGTPPPPPAFVLGRHRDEPPSGQRVEEARFDAGFYRAVHTDLVLPDAPAAWRHWVSEGRPAGRLARFMDGDGSMTPDRFDHAFYRAAHADLEAAFGDDAPALWNHWIAFGIAEGRPVRVRRS